MSDASRNEDQAVLAREPVSQPDRGRSNAQVDPAFAPFALWTAASFGLLILSMHGPKFWATQQGENTAISVEIVAVGQALLAAIAWPMWTRSVESAIGVVLSSPAWLLLAGRIAASPMDTTVGFLWKLAASLALLALIRLATPRAAVGFVWAAIVATAIGGPALWLFAKGG